MSSRYTSTSSGILGSDMPINGNDSRRSRSVSRNEGTVVSAAILLFEMLVIFENASNSLRTSRELFKLCLPSRIVFI